MRFKIGISPCPNDTYIFEALAENKIKLNDVGLDFEYHDIAVLNQKAQRQELDIVKISYANYFQVADEYVLLRSGGAMGFGVGPLLLSREELIPNEHHSCAIPGVNTTANFLLQFAYPQLKKKTAIPFDQIEQAVLSNAFDLGLVIHESRFTYAAKGLYKILDLGAHWEEKKKLPIPLGGIAIKRSLAEQYGQELCQATRHSIGWQEQQATLSNYIQDHAQEMQPEVMQQHINLYVNDFSKDIGTDGEQAINFMKEILLLILTKPYLQHVRLEIQNL